MGQNNTAVKISVIIPVFNLEDCLAGCLESVFSQTSPADEVILIDDGSTDRTIEIASRFPIRLLRQVNSGPAVARNYGVREAKGEWVAFLDGDDHWLPTKIEKLRQKIAELPDAVIVATDDLMGSLGGPYTSRPLHMGLDPHRQTFSQLYRGCFLATSTVAARRDAFLRVGGMDESLRSAQDYDTWLRLVRVGELTFINEPLTRYHIRQGSISFNIPKRLDCSLRIADKYAGLVSKRLYLYRIALVYYEAFQSALRQRQYKAAISAVFKMPFSVLRRSLSSR